MFWEVWSLMCVHLLTRDSRVVTEETSSTVFGDVFRFLSPPRPFWSTLSLLSQHDFSKGLFLSDEIHHFITFFLPSMVISFLLLILLVTRRPNLNSYRFIWIPKITYLSIYRSMYAPIYLCFYVYNPTTFSINIKKGNDDYHLCR